MGRALGYVGFTGPDRRLDTTGYFDDPVNVLPVKCANCTFPDLDHVPQPYRLARGIDRPVDLAPANLGNFLARDRARRVIEAACPGQCRFHPTTVKKTNDAAPWFLAVPTHHIAIGRVRAEVPRCSACGEPKTCHVNEFEPDPPGAIEWDVAKSLSWGSHNDTIGLERDRAKLRAAYGPRAEIMAADTGWARQRIYRYLFFSLRLELLLKKLKIKGMTRLAGDSGAPTGEDRAWVDEQVDRLNRLGFGSPPGRDGREDQGWFDAYLKKHRKRRGAPHDFGPIEAALGASLPPTYKVFVDQVGAEIFRNVEGEEGFEARILLPQDLDLTSYRQGAVPMDGEEDRQVDAVLFAATGHGDGFCFDLAAGGPEYPVYLYDHEANVFDAYAPNFGGCIRRFIGEDG
ncbi:SMI1/KNR4 family protein [Paludisphaera mucosa]|uniref:SMI1/KNR4 family protein n=1 Tax=Paludisphaera mucosa TaxID=3030827 RepID=A0ABT6F4W2_9BACT|nr:SMI1/KNR4 family protein [Paludisphaera mucosa]MDG3002440.1 SMI1/KNR4 family protein [Paludisphaera mucosa]